MEIKRPLVNYSVAISDSTIILSPGDPSKTDGKTEINSLAYRFPEKGGLTLVGNRIIIEKYYQFKLDQVVKPEILGNQLDMHDIEFVFYQGLPYLYYTDYELLLIQVPECLCEILDPISDKYFTTIIENTVYIGKISLLGRLIKKIPMKLENGVTISDRDDTDNNDDKYMLGSFTKYNNTYHLTDCYLLPQKGYITLVTDKFDKHLCMTLASVSSDEII